MTRSLRTRGAAAVAALATGGALLVTGTTAANAAPSAAVTTVPIGSGLYQSAYSARNHVLWATTSVGRPPVTESHLLKIDPRTLKVEASYTPPVTDTATGAVEAVYGVAVDDVHDTVWTTNTRDDSVAVYSQRTGAHLATLPGVNHAREVDVDERHNLAWASGFGDGRLIAFDTRTFKVRKTVTVDGAGPAGVAVNDRTGTVYATDLNGDRIIATSLRAETPRFVPAGDGPISVALSADGRTAYTADQTGGSVSVVDLKKGAVTGSVPTGAGALSVATDPRSGRVLVANRTAATLSVVDPAAGKVTETIETPRNPNHVETAGGAAYVLDKSGSGPAGEDQLTRVRLAR